MMDDIFRDVSRREWLNDIRTVWMLTRRHLGILVVAAVCGVVVSLTNGAIAWLVKPAIENITASTDTSILVLLPLGVLVLFIVRGLFIFCNNFLMNAISAKIVRFLRTMLYDRLLALPMSYFARKSSGSVISRLLNDIASLEKSIANLTKDFIVESLTVLVLAAVVIHRRWDLALLSFTVIPLVVVISERLGRRMKRVSKKRRRLIARITSVIQETLQGMRVVKSYSLEPVMRRNNTKAIAEHYRNVLREVRVDEFTGFLLECIAGLGVAVILWYGTRLIYYGELSMAEFLSFTVAVFMFYTPLKRLSRLNNNFQKVRTGLHRIKDISTIESEPDGDVVRERIEGHVSFNHVSFSYPGLASPVLDDIQLEISPGETVAIVGFSGAGKSTLADLLLGFWDGYAGTIELDSLDIRLYAKRNLRSHMGVVSQDIILFDDTVRNNILYGRPDATEREMEEAARIAHAHDFIVQMPNGYDTHIGERGVKLSGGQKQRISLARAVIKNPKILVLDEATSSLDADSEAKIQSALETIMPGRTTIVIAHRLSTIKRANRIIVLDHGRIIQQGSHDKLHAQVGVYQELYNTQFGPADA